MDTRDKLIDILSILFGVLCILLVWLVMIPIRLVIYIIDLGNMIENKVRDK